MIIGYGGMSGIGKTTLMKRVAQRLKDLNYNVLHVGLDKPEFWKDIKDKQEQQILYEEHYLNEFEDAFYWHINNPKGIALVDRVPFDMLTHSKLYKVSSIMEALALQFSFQIYFDAPYDYVEIIEERRGHIYNKEEIHYLLGEYKKQDFANVIIFEPDKDVEEKITIIINEIVSRIIERNR